jgi:hypothetical protein
MPTELMMHMGLVHVADGKVMRPRQTILLADFDGYSLLMLAAF